MQFLDLTLPTLAENLALDEALLLEAEAGRSSEVLRVWEWKEPALVLGSGCRLTEDVNEGACRLDGVEIARRSSGGGTVLLASGCLCYSLVLAYERSAALAEIRPSYVHILGHIRAALADLEPIRKRGQTPSSAMKNWAKRPIRGGLTPFPDRLLLPHIEKAGLSDLAAAGLKFSGNSQQRKRSYLLHHGTLLYNFDLERVGHYLHVPNRQPEYRQNRDHAAFLINLPTTAAELTHRLRATWAAQQVMNEWPAHLVRKLTAEKYGRPEWIRRR